MTQKTPNSDFKNSVANTTDEATPSKRFPGIDHNGLSFDDGQVNFTPIND